MRPVLTLLAVAGCAAAAEPQPKEIRLKITAAAEPVPALKYRLLPEVRELTAGNAALLYYRAFSPEWSSSYRRDPKTLETLRNFVTLPPDEAKSLIDEVKPFEGAAYQREIDRAARRTYCEWEYDQRAREEGIALLLPDVQEMRNFATLLSVRSRLALFDGRFRDATTAMQSQFALARHVSQSPTLIQSLVGIAIVGSGQDSLDEWIGTAGSPNLYWALTDLPRPFIDLRRALQGERLIVDALFPGIREALDDPNAPPKSALELKQMLDTMTRMTDSQEAMLAWAGHALRYPAAKAYLKKRGWTEGQLNKLPLLQVVYMHEIAEYDIEYDAMRKWYAAPYPAVSAAMKQFEPGLRQRQESQNLYLARLLLPATRKIYMAGVRSERRFAAQRTVEAIRLHLAEKGTFPAHLGELTVPVPTDPVTERAFEYRRTEAGAELYGPPPGDERPDERNSIRYLLTKSE